MKVINNLKISVKLTGGFLLVALLIGVVALVGYTNMKNINDGMTTLYFDRTLPIQEIGAAQAALYTIRGDVYKYILIPEFRTQSRQAIDKDVQTIKENFDKYRATSLVTEEKTALAAFDKDFAVYQKAFEKVLADIDAGNQAQAILSIKDGGETSTTRSAVAAAMDEIISINSRIAEQINTDGDVTFAASVRILVIVSLAGIFLAMGLGLFLSRSLSNGIKLLVKTAEQISQTDLPSFADAITAIANGDLTKSVSVQTQSVAYDSKDEMGDLARTFNTMITNLQDVGTNFARMTTNLQELIGEVSQSALTVGSTSNQLATAADQTGN
ncbi:MAG: MCP four helix bundle domain-containing protein, partial [Chloroflexota bacterium]